MKLSDRISFRLVVIFVALTTLLIGMFGAYSYLSSKRRMESQLHSQIGRAVSRLQIGLPGPVWNFEKQQLSALLDAEMGDPAVSAIIVLGADKKFIDGRVRNAQWEKVLATPESKSNDEFITAKLEWDDSGTLTPVGTVNVYMSRTAINQALREEIIKVIAQVIVLDLALVAALVLGLNTVVLRSLNRVREALEVISSGDADLTQRLEVNREDEIGEVARLFNVFVERLQGIVRQIHVSAEALGHATAEIASGNMDLSARTERQASSLEQTAASMEDLTHTVQRNTDNARHATEVVSTTSSVAAKGGEVMAQVITTMDAINTSSKKIVDIISIIDGIAFQTNILALNAAIEAARAGEHGRGFAVVANEVRVLSGRSAAAAKDIAGLINEASRNTAIGCQLVNEAGATMNDIVSGVQKGSVIMEEITLASQQQMSGIAQINEAIKDMDIVTQQNAALVEQAAAASASMQDQSTNLVNVVSVFRVD